GLNWISIRDFIHSLEYIWNAFAIRMYLEYYSIKRFFFFFFVIFEKFCHFFDFDAFCVVLAHKKAFSIF
ncbi:hypothetical protein ACLF9E_03600, partial [Helicobacter pylori]